MRFRKTITICKGLKVNLSKSGMSLTAGVDGLSVNLGKNGVYLNTGLPGTGIYDRHKLFGGKKSKKKKEEARELDVNNYQLEMDETGKIEILTVDGARVPEADARKLRATDWYDEQSDALMDQFREEFNAENAAFVQLHHNAQKVPPLGDIEPAETVEAAIDAWLADLELPVDFDVQYEYNAENGSVMMDLDVPELEDLPEEKAVELASGAVKVKEKTKAELREEYRTCVLGLAIFFASHVFLASNGVSDVLISGYTQRRDRQTGEREDCYIYSIAFERSAFKTAKCTREDPMDFCDQFRSRINYLASGEMKEIVPYTPEEFQEMLEE